MKFEVNNGLIELVISAEEEAEIARATGLRLELDGDSVCGASTLSDGRVVAWSVSLIKEAKPPS